MVIDFSRSIYHTTECASYTEIVVTTKHSYVIDTRLAFTDDKITKIESIVCNDGDWLFNAKRPLSYNQRESWIPILEGQRDSREVIKAAGDTYINAWGDKVLNPPFATQCALHEGGSWVVS